MTEIVVDGVAEFTNAIPHTTKKGKDCWYIYGGGKKWWIWEEALAKRMTQKETYEYIGTDRGGFRTLKWATLEGSIQPAWTLPGWDEAERLVKEYFEAEDL